MSPVNSDFFLGCRHHGDLKLYTGLPFIRCWSILVRLVREDLVNPDFEYMRDAEAEFHRWTVFVFLHGDDRISRDANKCCELLLCHVPLGPEYFDSVFHGVPFSSILSVIIQIKRTK